MLTVVVIGFVVGMIYLSGIGNVIETQVIEPRKWSPIVTGAIDGDMFPGVGESGVVGVFVNTHEADPYTAYETNLTNATGSVLAYGLLSSYGVGNLSGNVPYDTAFDIVVRVRWNRTHAYSTNNETWMLPWVNASLTASNDAGATTYFPISAVGMGEVNVSGQTPAEDLTYLYVQYYIQAKAAVNGTGLQISHGDTVNCSYFEAWAFY